uniref:Serine/threonine-protein phosphatase 2A activator 2 n=1 Tax=Lygus hesperus TaxID=30085 RepID=A0A0A9WSA3_LYGHE
MAMCTICYFETYDAASATRNEWRDMTSSSNVKFKSRRSILGYVYDFFVYRKQKYLVSCFQELVGVLPDKRRELQRQRQMQAGGVRQQTGGTHTNKRIRKKLARRVEWERQQLLVSQSVQGPDLQSQPVSLPSLALRSPLKSLNELESLKDQHGDGDVAVLDAVITTNVDAGDTSSFDTEESNYQPSFSSFASTTSSAVNPVRTIRLKDVDSHPQTPQRYQQFLNDAFQSLSLSAAAKQ